MDLKHELFQNYTYNHKYKDIIDLCKKYGKDESNLWIQTLIYFVRMCKMGAKDILISHITEIAENMFEQKTIAPI